VAIQLQSDNIPDTSTVTVNADGRYILNHQTEVIGPLVVSSGTVDVDAGLVSFSALTMTGGAIGAGATGEVQFRGDVTVNASITGSTISGTGHVQLGNATRTFTVADGIAAIDLNIAAKVRSTGSISAGLTKAGPGALRLGRPGTFAGAATLSAGTLLVGDDTALGTGTFVITGGTLQADGAAQTLANALTLGGDFTVAGGLALIFNGAAALTGNRTITVTNTGLTNFNGAIGPTFFNALTKAGAGTLRLSGTTNNTYTGPTTVSDGTLELNKTLGAVAFGGKLVVGDGAGPAGSAVARHLQSDNIPDTSTVTVNADGLYDLNGQSDTVGAVTVTGGTVKTSGANLGRVTAGNTSFNAASTLAMKLAGTGTSDRLTVNGTIAVGGTLQLSLAQTVAAGAVITLIDNDGTDPVTGTFTGLPQGGARVVGGQTFVISYTGGSDNNDVVLTRVVSPRILSTQINGGAAQRSMVTQIAITFSTVVTLPLDVFSAFTLTRVGGGAVTISLAQTTNLGGITVLTLTGFTGPEASQGGSLNDGRYTLTALASQITANGLQLDGNGNGFAGDNFVLTDSGQATGNQLYRFFGDVNGDRFVNGFDFASFRTAFGTASGNANYNAAFDVNGDGFVNGADFTPFRTNFGGSI
jgi:autotransporter-associated beta strand protein